MSRICSIAPDSRRSLSWGSSLLLYGIPRRGLTGTGAMMGTCSLWPSPFSAREDLADLLFTVAFLFSLEPLISCR